MNRLIKDYGAYLPMLSATLLWAGAYICGKLGVDEFIPLHLLFFRFLIASIFIFIVIALRKKQEWKISVHDIPVLFILGFTGVFANNLFFFLALLYTSVTNAAIIFATTPFMTAILAFIFLKEPLGLKNICALIIALSGVIFLVTNGDIHALLHMNFNIGDLYEVGASFALAVFTIISRKVANNYAPITMVGYENLFSLIITIPLLLITGALDLQVTPTYKGWLSILYLGVFASALGYIFQQISIKSIGASKSAAFLNLTPFLSVLLGMIFLGESLSTVKIISGMLILAGIYLNSYSNRQAVPCVEKCHNN